MKQIIITILLTLLSLALSAQQKYQVFENSSGATLFSKATSTWISCTKKMDLTGTDIIKVSKKGGLKILDCSTNRIYTNVSTGSLSVNQIVKASKDKSETIVQNLNKELKRSVKGIDNGTRYVTYGATSRGDKEIGYADSLYATIYKGITKQNGKESKSVIHASKINTDDGTYHFIINNDSDNTAYCQIIKLTDGIAVPCYDMRFGGFDCLPIASSSTLDLSPFSFMEEANEEFYLICTGYPFSLVPVIGLLRRFQVPKVDVSLEDLIIEKIEQ